MAVELDDVFRRGGPDLVALLNYCVYSVQPEPLFAFLVREFHFDPTAIRAVTLHDVFCAPGAPARLRAPAVLEPRDLRLRRTIDALRAALVRPAPAQVGVTPSILSVHPSIPVKDLKGLIALAKANPGKLTYGSAGLGSILHLCGEQFKTGAGGLNILHVPYRGSTPMNADLMAGHVAMALPRRVEPGVRCPI